MANNNIDIGGLIHTLQAANRPYDFIVEQVAGTLKASLGLFALEHDDYREMAASIVAKYTHNENLNQQQNVTQSNEQSFTFDSSPSKQMPHSDSAWSQTRHSEEELSTKQKTRVTHRSPLTTSVNHRKVKSPKRRGRSPARSPGPRAAAAIPSQNRSRRRTRADQPYREPNLNSEHVSTRFSKSPVPNRSPHRSPTHCSTSVYYDCEQSFSKYRNNDSPGFAREAGGEAELNGLNASMGSLFVNTDQSPAFHRSMAGLNSSVNKLSFNDSFHNSHLDDSFQKCSLDDTKLSFDYSQGKPSAAASGLSPRANMEPKTPMTTSNSTECSGTVEQLSPVEDTPQNVKHPEEGTKVDGASTQPTSSGRSRSRSRSPVRNTTTSDSRGGASVPNREPVQAWRQHAAAAAPFASPISEFQAPHEVLAASQPRGWRNARPSPVSYADANSPSFLNSFAQNAAKDPPATTASSSFGADNPTVNRQPTADDQFKFNVNLNVSDKALKKRASRRGLRGKAGSTRRSQNNAKPTSFDPASSMASPSNSSPPEPMDCGTPAQPNLNDVQFNIGVGGKSSGKPRVKKRDVKKTPAPMQAHQSIPTAAQQPQSVQNESPIQFNIGVGGKRNTRGNQRAQRSQSAYFHSENVASASQVGNQGFRANSLAEDPGVLLSINEAKISTLRDDANALYRNNDFKGALLKYTETISEYRNLYSDFSLDKNLLAKLFSNRAACLMSLGAYQAAIEDCQQSLMILPQNQDSTSNDFDPTFKAKVHCRMARAQIQLGMVDEAKKQFVEAEKDIKRVQRHFDIESKALIGVSNKISNGIMDIGTFNEKIQYIVQYNKKKDYALRKADWVKMRIDVLVHVNCALGMASGCDHLHEQKVSILADLKWWREIASHCGRLAASRTKLDGCFVEDLAHKNIFPSVEPAKSLNADSFKGFDENELRGASRTLNTSSICEAVLRLPHSIIPYYARSLRLEENYKPAEEMLDTLKTHLSKNPRAFGLANAWNEFGWLLREKQLVAHTKEKRQEADKLFKRGRYKEAAEGYEHCLGIDPDAGGRSQAVLHCNRAACFIQLKRYHEALTECTSAKRIHPHYMKAIKRRATSYEKMDRYDECIAECKEWIDLVNKARSGRLHFRPGLCIFDGPEEATNAEMEEVKTTMKDAIGRRDRASARARGEAGFQQNPFHKNAPKGEAERRREQWYSQKNDSRRWDSFKDRKPKRSHSKPRSKPSQNQHSTRHSYKENNASSSNSNGSQNSREPDISANSDHYSVLGIRRNATEGEIKKAYRKMALKYHPDKNKEKGAADVFRRAEEAKTILMDAQSREEYDRKQFGRW